jgi:hypothetical protein
MNKEETVRKNLDLLNEFMKYAFEHPQVLDQIPSGAELVILPQDDSELMRENTRLAKAQVSAGKQVILFKFRRPEPVTPEFELVKG